MKKILSIAVVLALFCSCGPRIITPQKAHNKMTSHFQKYGKKYKESEFGQHKIDHVEIVAVREIQKHYAEADAYAVLSDGTKQKVRVTFQKKTFGWKVISWENLGPA